MLTGPKHPTDIKSRYVKALLLVVGPTTFVVGGLMFGYNKFNSIQVASSEWIRYKNERNNFLETEKARLNADLYKQNLEHSKNDEVAKYFAEFPAVMNSIEGMTLVNFAKTINGIPAKYSYKISVGQQVYNVQGKITIKGNDMYYEDDYSKTSSELISSGEVKHQRDPQGEHLTLQLITTKNTGELSNLGDIRSFTFKYK